MLESVARPKIRDGIAEQLRSYISSANLQPGDRLPTETQLAQKFGVSRLSLREATKALEYLGEAYVKMGKLDDARAVLGRLEPLDKKEAAELRAAIDKARK